MTTTSESITEQQIKTLRREAAQAGDEQQAAICDIAVEGDAATACAGLNAVQIANLERRGLLDHDAARAECARVIAENEAQS